MGGEGGEGREGEGRETLCLCDAVVHTSPLTCVKAYTCPVSWARSSARPCRSGQATAGQAREASGRATGPCRNVTCHAAMRSRSHAAMQSCGHAAMKSSCHVVMLLCCYAGMPYHIAHHIIPHCTIPGMVYVRSFMSMAHLVLSRQLCHTCHGPGNGHGGNAR